MKRIRADAKLGYNLKNVSSVRKSGYHQANYML